MLTYLQNKRNFLLPQTSLLLDMALQVGACRLGRDCLVNFLYDMFTLQVGACRLGLYDMLSGGCHMNLGPHEDLKPLTSEPSPLLYPAAQRDLKGAASLRQHPCGSIPAAASPRQHLRSSIPAAASPRQYPRGTTMARFSRVLVPQSRSNAFPADLATYSIH